ncbi:MAG: amidohydrolase family protein [Chloroflexota bacterium]
MPDRWEDRTTVLIHHGVIITNDERLGVLGDGAVRLEGQRIVDVGASAALLERYPEDERLDACGLLVLPGLVSLHTHLHRTLVRGRLAALAQPQPERLRVEAALNYEDIRYAMLMGAMEALRRGTTTVFDQLSAPNARRFALDAAAEALLQCGLRACLSYVVSDRDGLGEGRHGIQENVRFAQRAEGEPLLCGSIGLGTCTSLSNETLRAAVGAAALADLGFHVGLGTYRGELRDCELRYHEGAVQRLYAAGVLGPRTLIVYGPPFPQIGLDLIRRAHATIVFAPRMISLARGELGDVAQLPELLRQSLSLTLGSGELAADTLSEAQEAYRILARHRGGAGAAEAVRAMLGANSTLAARFFRDRLGALAPDYLADLVILNYAGADQVTADNWPYHVLAATDAAAVHTAVVGGRVVLHRGHLTLVDEEAIAAHAREQCRDLLARL